VTLAANSLSDIFVLHCFS